MMFWKGTLQSRGSLAERHTLKELAVMLTVPFFSTCWPNWAYAENIFSCCTWWTLWSAWACVRIQGRFRILQQWKPRFHLFTWLPFHFALDRESCSYGIHFCTSHTILTVTAFLWFQSWGTNLVENEACAEDTFCFTCCNKTNGGKCTVGQQKMRASRFGQQTKLSLEAWLANTRGSQHNQAAWQI